MPPLERVAPDRLRAGARERLLPLESIDGGIESRLRKLGQNLNIHKVHPHNFRRTLATMAIDKGMPIEQLQRLLGHQRIDTTLQFAIPRFWKARILP